ncbi:MULTISPECIES: hypothetical protein [Novosphingobium]|uniref:hypothetical protein n=1 Tax=Novosphingobium TaxID=165696 RepID=UPI0012EE9AFB|nr:MULTISPECIES: hypothetical protein [Novosphingobium]MBB3359663.1 hypothetical protein [Novosphingobium sp. BK256]MBB3375971.1 hypothetical protein [Novosphingobium sp. BK280]MBB3380436.1 hypothetical protein [Novosphingobium sp. BK258]MBB3422088.1 hypothetical protein [Novosphingobium sp. BK267]MBB3450735.1 hypothetical protein [Novosphingobium sp. BK352]
MRSAAWTVALASLALAACQREPAPQESASPTATPSASATPEPTPTPPAPSPSPTLALPVKPTPDVPLTPADTASALPAIALPPRDDCAALPGWSAFATRLAAAVKTRDAAALAALSSPDVTLDYGGGHGPAQLQKRLAAPAGAAIWADLARILPLGCAVQGDLVVMPWFFWNVPDEVDPGMTMLVTGQGVPLRAKPSDTAPEVDRLDWSLVTIATSPSYNPAARYTAVITGKPQRKGWIETARLRSLLARRIIAERKGDDWHISALVAGD